SQPPSPLSHAHALLTTPPTPAQLYTLSLHDALPISADQAHADDLDRATRLRAVAVEPLVLALEGIVQSLDGVGAVGQRHAQPRRSEEHTSELQSHLNLVCRLLLEKKNTFRPPTE